MKVSKVLFLILVYFLHFFSLTQLTFVILLSELTVTCNPNFFVCKSWVIYTKLNDASTFLVNIEGEVNKPGLNFLTVNLKAFLNPVGKLNETKKLLDLNTDICKFIKRKNRGNPFNSYVFELIHKYGKIPHCPIRVGHYYIHNLTTNGLDIPKFAEHLLGKSEVTIRFRYGAKLGKRIVSTMNVTIVGGYRNEK